MNLTPEERDLVEQQLHYLRGNIEYDRSWLKNLSTTYRAAHMIRQKTQEYEARIHQDELWVSIYEKLLAEAEPETTTP